MKSLKRKRKRSSQRPKKAPLKKPNKIHVDKNSGTSRTRENPAGESKRNEMSEKKVLEVSPGNQPTPASPVRPFGIHNPSSLALLVSLAQVENRCRGVEALLTQSASRE